MTTKYYLKTAGYFDKVGTASDAGNYHYSNARNYLEPMTIGATALSNDATRWMAAGT